MAVLPRPGRCIAATPARWADCARISPRMYDSVKRFDPMRIGSSASAFAPSTSTAAKIALRRVPRLVDRAAAREIEDRAGGKRTFFRAQPRNQRGDLLDGAE